LTVRDQLPATAGVAYLNAGTNGPLPEAAAEAMRRELAVSVDRPRITSAAFEGLFAVRDRARAALARAVSAPAEQVALTSSTTQGIGLIVAGIDWSAGDEVLTTTEEHQGLRSPLDVVARRCGVVVRELPADEIAAAIGPSTRMVAVSHVLWTTGRVLDLPSLAAACRANDAMLLADGAQSAGAIAVDAAATGADFYAFSGQKWLLGPQGSGGLWVAPRRVDQVWSAVSGYLNLEQGQVGAFKSTAGRFDGGSADPVTLSGLAAAVEWVESLPGGREGWLRRTADNAARARARLSAVPGIVLADPGPDPGPLIALAIDGAGDLPALVAALAEQGVLVRFIPNTPYLRVSVGAWTQAEDIERLVDALGAAVHSRPDG
jgi:L-cysteine/cystine lyase